VSKPLLAQIFHGSKRLPAPHPRQLTCYGRGRVPFTSAFALRRTRVCSLVYAKRIDAGTKNPRSETRCGTTWAPNIVANCRAKSDTPPVPDVTKVSPAFTWRAPVIARIHRGQQPIGTGVRYPIRGAGRTQRARAGPRTPGTHPGRRSAGRAAAALWPLPHHRPVTATRRLVLVPQRLAPGPSVIRRPCCLYHSTPWST